MVKIGMAGINTMERYFVERQMSFQFPEISLCPVTHPFEIQQLEALILGQIACTQWVPHVPDKMPLIVFVGAHNHQITGLTEKRAVLLCSNDAIGLLETEIACWIAVLKAPVNQQMPRRRARNLFSERETQVLELLREGTSNDGIANLLDIKPSTVKTYLRRIYERMGATNRTHAVALYKAHFP